MQNKKVMVALVLLMFIFGFTFTIAFFTDSFDIPNVFKTQVFKTTVEEEFISPDNWLPGDVTLKKIRVNNVGDLSVAARISIKEEWVAHDGEKLSGIQNGNKAAIINFVNTDKWIKDGDYYYYNKKLKKGESSLDFIESVTFNDKIEAESECNRHESNGVIQIVCSSSTLGYANATYTLTFKIDTVQYDLYKEIWNTNININ